VCRSTWRMLPAGRPHAMLAAMLTLQCTVKQPRLVCRLNGMNEIYSAAKVQALASVVHSVDTSHYLDTSSERQNPY
jgi:hypothetical protein